VGLSKKKRRGGYYRRSRLETGPGYVNPTRRVCVPAHSLRKGRVRTRALPNFVETLVKPLTTRHWSDWVGTIAFTAIAVGLWRQSPEFGVLLLLGLIQELLIAASFLVRSRPKSVAPSWTSRVVAYVNSFLVMIFILVAGRVQPDWLRPTPNGTLRSAGAFLWLAAAVLCLWPLWYLRRSFSLEPEARTLVTSGPYRLARHPVYTVYLLINAGILLRHLTVPFALVLSAWLILLVIRVHYEEGVLTEAFPEYKDYQRRVRAFGVIG